MSDRGTMPTVTAVAGDAAEYRRLATEWGAGSLGEAKDQNSLFDRLHAVQTRLAETAEGQAAIAALMTDSDPWVRLAASAHSLRWAEEKARLVLEDLRDADTTMAGFNAKYVLREYDAGRLTFEF